MIQTFEQFLEQSQEWDMYITGQAGTGKTTDLATLVEYCEQHDIEALSCTYTHKACRILRSKLPSYAKVVTLHSFLRKRPSINQHATHIKQISSSQQSGTPDKVQILFVDEFSMVGEKDLMDIRAMQDPDYEGEPMMKVVWIGDLNQLPPVGDKQTIKPRKPFWIDLKTIKRQASDNPLITPLTQLVSFINGADPVPLIESEAFIRGQDIVGWYGEALAEKWGEIQADGAIYDPSIDSVVLAYTNERVQELNAEIQGHTRPSKGVQLFSPTTQYVYEFVGKLEASEVAFIDMHFGERLGFNSKFKTLEHLLKMDACEFMDVEDPDNEGELLTYAVVFGHYDYKCKLEELKKTAAASNKAIESQFNQNAASWVKMNPRHKLARARAKAWRDFLTFNDCVICLDFSHAMTVHKSQGSTYENVYVDTEDLARCADFDYTMYLKLMYVALSRASNKVVTN